MPKPRRVSSLVPSSGRNSISKITENESYEYDSKDSKKSARDRTKTLLGTSPLKSSLKKASPLQKPGFKIKVNVGGGGGGGKIKINVGGGNDSKI